MTSSLDEAERDRVGRVFEDHRDFIEAVAARHAFNQADVPDIVQNVGVSLCSALKSFRDQAHIKTWLFRVTVNKARDYYRRESRAERIRDSYETLVLKVDQGGQHPDDVVHQGERMAALRDAVQRLRPTHQQTIANILRGPGVKDDDQDTRRQGSGPRGALFRARHALRVRMVNDRRFD